MVTSSVYCHHGLNAVNIHFFFLLSFLRMPSYSASVQKPRAECRKEIVLSTALPMTGLFVPSVVCVLPFAPEALMLDC